MNTLTVKNNFFKKIGVLLLALVLFFCPVALVGCDNASSDAQSSYDNLSSLFTKIAEDKEGSTPLFSTTTISGLSTDYALTYYVGNSDSRYLNELIIVPMNFVSTYYSNLQELVTLIDEEGVSSETSGYLSTLSSASANLLEAFDDALSTYQRLKSFSSSSTVIVEGAEQMFISSVKDVMDYAYQTAISLANALEEAYGMFTDFAKTDAAITSQNVVDMAEYYTLFVANDYYELFSELISLDITYDTDETAELYNFISSAKTNLTTCINKLATVSTSSVADLNGTPTSVGEGEDARYVYTSEKVASLNSCFETMQEEREILASCYEKFSLYKYYQNYSCNITSYEKDVEFASNYYERIETYFTDYLTSYVTYYLGIILN